MANEQETLAQARELIKAKQLDEARALLNPISHNPTAQRWLSKIDELTADAQLFEADAAAVEDAIEQARELINFERYDQARAILLQAPPHPKISEWLTKLDDIAPVGQKSTVGSVFDDDDASSRSTTGIIIAAVVVLALVVGGIVAFLVLSGGDSDEPTSTAAPPPAILTYDTEAFAFQYINRWQIVSEDGAVVTLANFEPDAAASELQSGQATITVQRREDPTLDFVTILEFLQTQNASYAATLSEPAALPDIVDAAIATYQVSETLETTVVMARRSPEWVIEVAVEAPTGESMGYQATLVSIANTFFTRQQINATADFGTQQAQSQANETATAIVEATNAFAFTSSLGIPLAQSFSDIPRQHAFNYPLGWQLRNETTLDGTVVLSGETTITEEGGYSVPTGHGYIEITSTTVQQLDTLQPFVDAISQTLGLQPTQELEALEVERNGIVVTYDNPDGLDAIAVLINEAGRLYTIVLQHDGLPSSRELVVSMAESVGPLN